MYKNILQSVVTVKVGSEDANVLPLTRMFLCCVSLTISLQTHFHSHRVLLIGHTLRKDCLLGQVTDGKIEGRIEVTGRRGRRRKKLMDDLAEKRGCSKWKEGALDRTVWRSGSGTGYGSVVRQAKKRTNE